MSNKDSRAGGKYGGTHTTLIPAAALLCDIAHACASVSRISPGFIRAGLKSVSGQRRVKITGQESPILLSVRDNTSHQEVRIYTTDVQASTLSIARGARDANIIISFGNNSEAA